MSARAFDYETSQTLRFDKRRTAINVFGSHPLNNPDRPRYSESKDAAQALLVDTTSVLAEGNPRQRQAYWQALRGIVALGYLSTEKAKKETEAKVASDIASLGASSQALSESQSNALMGFIGVRTLINQALPDDTRDSARSLAFETATNEALQLVHAGREAGDHNNRRLPTAADNAALSAIYSNENWPTLVASIREIYQGVGESEDAISMNAFVNQPFLATSELIDGPDGPETVTVDSGSEDVVIDAATRFNTTRQILVSAGKFEPIARFEHDKATTELLTSRDLVVANTEDPSVTRVHTRALTAYLDNVALGAAPAALSPIIQPHADQILASADFQRYQEIASARFAHLPEGERLRTLDSVIAAAKGDYNNPMANLDFVMTTRQEAEVLRHLVAFAVIQGPELPSPEVVNQAAARIRESLSTPVTARAPSLVLRNTPKTIELKPGVPKTDTEPSIPPVTVPHPYWRLFELGMDKAPHRLNDKGVQIDGDAPVLSQDVVIQASIFGSASYKMQFPTIAVEGANYFKNTDVIAREINKIAEQNASRSPHERTAMIVIADPNAGDPRSHSRTTAAILEIAQAKGFAIIPVDASISKNRSRDFSTGEPRTVITNGMSYTIPVSLPDTIDANGKTVANVRDVPLYSTEGQRLARGSVAANNAVYLTKTSQIDGVSRTERLDPTFGEGKKIVAGRFYKNFDPNSVFNVVSTNADGSLKSTSIFTAEGKAILAAQVETAARTIGAVILIRPRDEGTTIYSTEAEAKHARLIGWQTSQSLARETLVFGASRTDFNTSQIIRRSMDSGKITTVLDDAGKVMDPAKAMEHAKYGAPRTRDTDNMTPQAFQRRESARGYPLSGDLIRVTLATLAGQDTADRVGATANRLRREKSLDKPLTFGDLVEFGKMSTVALKAMTDERGEIARDIIKAAGPMLSKLDNHRELDRALNHAWRIKNTTFPTVEDKTGTAQTNPNYRGDFYTPLVTGDMAKANGGAISIYANKDNLAVLTKPSLAIIGAEKQAHPATMAPGINALVAEAAKKGATISTVADETGALVIRAAAAHNASVMVVGAGTERTGLDRETAAVLRDMIAKGRAAYVTNDLTVDHTSETPTVHNRLRTLELATTTAKTVVMAGAPSNDPAVVITARAGLNARTMESGGKSIATLSLPPNIEYGGNRDLAQPSGTAVLRNGTGGVGLGNVAVGFVATDGRFESEARKNDSAIQTVPIHMIASWIEPTQTISSTPDIQKVVAASISDNPYRAGPFVGLTARDLALATGAARHPTPNEMKDTVLSNDNAQEKVYEPDAWRKVFEEANGNGRVSSIRITRDARVSKAMGI